MLSPHDRTSLFDALRPPPGYELDHAVGTSFTLDLEALLTAPIAFALFASQDAAPSEEGLEPVGLLEAIRRHSARVTMFCQSGQIAVPARHRTVFAWLEAAVHEVAPPRPHHIFHPKVWVARYTARTGGQRVLRVLCGTRNLTFDTSWDTLLRLESDPYHGTPATTGSGQVELAELVRRLPALAVRSVPADRLDVIGDLAADMAAVPLAVPEPFDDLRLRVLGSEGSGGSGDDPLPNGADRSLAVSPFLSESWLRRFVDRGAAGVLVSREESLDRIHADVLAAFERVAVLNPAADVAPEAAAGTPSDGHDDTGASDPATDGTAPDISSTASSTVSSTPTEAGDPARLFGGLHAKLFVFDTPAGAVVLTGSANATDAAFGGNVEVVAELRGPADAGVDRFMAETPGEADFVDLLVDYTPRDQPVDANETERLELALDDVRRRLAAVDFRATVEPTGDDFRLTLTSDQSLPRLDGETEVEAAVRPITLADRQATTSLTLGEPVYAEFGVTLEGISAFFAVTLTARRGQDSVTTTFMVTTELVGVPPDRESRLLAAMLRDPDRLMRYLLLLLSDADPLLGDGSGTGVTQWTRGWSGTGWDDMPLLELLVRAADRFPDRLEHIEHLLRDLAGQGEQVLPAGFDELWEPVWRYHEGARQ
jgi:hypothetical protein